MFIIIAVAVMVHLTPRDVLRRQDYLDFMQSFPQTTQHILVAESMAKGIPIMKKSAMLHTKLHFLDPIAFQPLHHSIEEQYDDPFPSNTTPGINMLKYCLRPVAKRGYMHGTFSYTTL
jgi:hypothetical protein